jgi:hypothetical protein
VDAGEGEAEEGVQDQEVREFDDLRREGGREGGVRGRKEGEEGEEGEEGRGRR